jgi:NAD(P)H-flavin reductase
MAAAEPQDPFLPQPYRLESVQRELHDTVTLEIVPARGKRPDFAPGQFNMLYALGVGEIAISISSVNDGGNAFVHTVRDVGAVSGAIAGLQAGSTIGVRGPFGCGWPVAAGEGSDVVIVAGGLGLAPLRPAIESILANRDRSGRVSILFGCRNPDEILFREQLGRWRQHLDLDIEVTVDHSDTEWRGNVGVVPDLVSKAAFDPDDTIGLVCGPEIMMRFTTIALKDAGVAMNRIYLSMERNMKCAIGLCGHCQFGPSFICKDGPVMRYDTIADIFAVREI